MRKAAYEEAPTAPRNEKGWPCNEYQMLANEQSVALDLLDLLDCGPLWIHRRVEAVEFYDDISVAHHVSMDLTVPKLAPCLPNASPPHRRVRILPLTMLAKAPLSGFDLRDESGRSLPVLTTHQNGNVGLSMLRAWAQSIVGSELHRTLTHYCEGWYMGSRTAAKP